MKCYISVNNFLYHIQSYLGCCEVHDKAKVEHKLIPNFPDGVQDSTGSQPGPNSRRRGGRGYKDTGWVQRHEGRQQEGQ